VADDAGRFQADPQLLKAKFFWNDGLITPEIVDNLLKTLERNTLIILYSTSKTLYGCLPTWEKHQSLRHIRPKYPSPPSRKLKRWQRLSGGFWGSNAPLTEGKGREGKENRRKDKDFRLSKTEIVKEFEDLHQEYGDDIYSQALKIVGERKPKNPLTYLRTLCRNLRERSADQRHQDKLAGYTESEVASPEQVTKTVNEMGRELDSLSDSLTFGIAPAVLTYQSFKTGGFFDIIIIIGAICFAIGAMLRLARFNISESPGYTGLPTPLSALLLINFFYANYFYAFAMGGNTYPFLEISSYIIPIFMVLIGWFNITTYIRYGEKDKSTYIIFLVIAPLCPILGIIGILNPDFLISIIVSIFFLGAFIFGLIFVIRGFFRHFIIRRKTTTPSQ